MDYRLILTVLFLIEVAIGAVLMVVGGIQGSALIIGLGVSVLLAHLFECFLLFKSKKQDIS